MSEHIDQIYEKIFPKDFYGQKYCSAETKVLIIKTLIDTELNIEKMVKEHRGY